MQQAMALISFGLAINIVGVLAYTFLHGKVKRLVYDMEWACNEILNYVSTMKEDDEDTETEVRT
jgi:biopolymer transport protein ExbB/TolQ